MKLKIKLENPKHCDGCPCHAFRMGGHYCKHFEVFLERKAKPEIPVNGATDIRHSYFSIRLQKCIEKGGL